MSTSCSMRCFRFFKFILIQYFKSYFDVIYKLRTVYFRNIGFLLFSVYFLFGQLIFPLGDFSLMRDLGSMYHKYKTIENAKEASPTDFVFDYLLHGETLFGHNSSEAPSKDYGLVQFIHQANTVNFILFIFLFSLLEVFHRKSNYLIFVSDYFSKGFLNQLFRPPHLIFSAF